MKISNERRMALIKEGERLHQEQKDILFLNRNLYTYHYYAIVLLLRNEKGGFDSDDIILLARDLYARGWGSTAILKVGDFEPRRIHPPPADCPRRRKTDIKSEKFDDQFI